MDNQVIDQVNIYEATKLAMKEAISQLSPQPEHLLIDAMKFGIINFTNLHHQGRC